MPERFDAIIVGADMAAGATALGLVSRGRRVLCVDPDPGRTGPSAVLWSAERAAVPAELAQTIAPYARIAEHHWEVLSDSGTISVEVRVGETPGDVEAPWVVDDATVGRRLIAQAVAGGAGAAEGLPVLLRAGAGVVGVKIGGVEFRSATTVVSDPRVEDRRDLPVPDGVSRSFRMDGSRLRGRFGLRSGEAATRESVLAFLTAPLRGVGFVIAHDETATAGVFLDSWDGPVPASALDQVLGQYLLHPGVAPLLEGAIPLGDALPRFRPAEPPPVNDPPGLLTIGRAAGRDVGSGPLVSGPGNTLRAGVLAAEVVAAGGPAPAGVYARRLASAGLTAAWSFQRERGHRVAFRPNLHGEYPATMAALLHRLMTESGGRKESVMAAVRATRRAKGARLRRLASDLLEAGGAL